MSKLYDVRFYFNHHNCFQNDRGRVKKMQLRDYIIEHNDEFTDIDYLRDSRYKIMIGDKATSFYGIKFSDNSVNIDETDLLNNVKLFINSLQYISPELQTWSSKLSNIDTSIIEDVKPQTPTQEQSKQVSSSYSNDIMKNMIISSTTPIRMSAISYYDIAVNKLLTFEEFRKTTVKIAIMQLNKEEEKDETIIEIEKQKRNALINEISMYRDVPEIREFSNDDVLNMSLERLEYCRNLCVKKYEEFKVLELFKGGSELIGGGYKMLFPSGIPIGNNKYVQLNNFGESMSRCLFDKRTIQGLSVSRLMKKWGLQTTDELFNIITVLGKAVQSISIVEKKEKDEDKDTQKDKDKDKNKDRERLLHHKKMYANREIKDVT